MRQVLGPYPPLPGRMSVDRDENGEPVYTYTPISDGNPHMNDGKQIKSLARRPLRAPPAAPKARLTHKRTLCKK